MLYTYVLNNTTNDSTQAMFEIVSFEDGERFSDYRYGLKAAYRLAYGWARAGCDPVEVREFCGTGRNGLPVCTLHKGPERPDYSMEERFRQKKWHIYAKCCFPD